jgi:methionyl-tRNA formyltransferase
VFAGTPDFAVPALGVLAAIGADVPLVLTQPDRPAGRGRRMTAPPVKIEAERFGFSVAQPERLPASLDAATWLPLPPDLMIVVAYGLLLPRWMLAWPRFGCVNVHASLLPRWRGAAPIQHAILAGDRETGVTLMQMDTGLDTGPVLASLATPIGANETGGQLHDRLAELGAELLLQALPALLRGALSAAPQDSALSTRAPKINKTDARLRFEAPAAELARKVRAFDPWPVAFGQLSDGRILRIFAASARPGGNGNPGTILAASREGIDVATGNGVLTLHRVQPPSSRVMSAEAYLAAHPISGLSFV